MSIKIKLNSDISYCTFSAILICVQLLVHEISAQSHCSQRAIIPEILLTTSEDPNSQQVGREYIVPKDVKKFVLNCSYPQPIDWRFEGVMANTLVSVERGQTYEEMWTWKNSCFYVALIFNNVQDQMTGNYKCFSRANEREVKSVTIFSGHTGEGKLSLILQGRTLNMTADLRKTVISFPCAVNSPEAEVQLHFQREDGQEWAEIPATRILSYSPAIGYIISVESFITDVGLYKCSLLGDSIKGDERNVLIRLEKLKECQAVPSQTDSASVLNIPANADSQYFLTCRSLIPISIKILKPSTLQVSSEIIESHNASSPYPYGATIFLQYTGLGEPITRHGVVQCLKNETNETIYTWTFKWTSPSPIGLELDTKRITAKCHSAYLTAITMTFIPCETLTECQFKSKCLEDNSINVCAHDGTFPELKTHQLGDTTIVAILPQQSGAVRCHSPDVESTRLYFMSASGQGIGEDVKNSIDIVKIQTSITNLEVGNKIIVECWLAERAFGPGPILTFKWKNDSTTQVPEGQIFNKSHTKLQGMIYLRAMVQILSTEVTQIGCLGLYFDTSGSTRRNQDLMVEESLLYRTLLKPRYNTRDINQIFEAKSTIIDGHLEETVVFSDGTPGNLTCSASTFPLPRISWKVPSNAKTFVKFHEEDQELSRVSTLIFTKFDTTLDGLFVCVVSDGNRIVEKKFTVNFTEVVDSTGTTIGIVIGVLVVLLLAGVGALIGYRYRKRQRSSSISDLSSPLSQKDIDEFLDGNQTAIAGSSDPYVIIQNSPYDKKYDILKEDLELDSNQILGTGAYGMVMKGKVKGESSETETSMSVAVKTVKPNAEPAYIKSLLTELKVMIYVGKNKHVVDLVGACTQNLADKQLYIVLQLCPNGGLETYLRNHRDGFVNQVERGRWDPSEIERMYVNTTEGTLYTADLIRWSHQIALGMEYLASKKVIHGDLATRNVLLDEGLVAKISDFGLARQMYEYTQYTKKQQAPLPWRWMSIESLRDMVFSTESDIWSFGITLWEIMTLAETPYPGLTWNPSFITTLLDGYRMSKPKYAPSEIYDIMLDCWREKPGDRINFTDLKEKFLEILETQFSSEYLSM